PDGERIEIHTKPPGRGFAGVVRLVPGAPPARPVEVRPSIERASLDTAELIPAASILRDQLVAVDSAIAVRGAGRGEAAPSGALAFHFAGAAPVPSALDVAALARALAGVVGDAPGRLDLLKGLV